MSEEVTEEPRKINVDTKEGALEFLIILASKVGLEREAASMRETAIRTFTNG